MATYRPSTSLISSAIYYGKIRAIIHAHQRLQEANNLISCYSKKDHSFGLNQQKNQTLEIKTNHERKEECSMTQDNSMTVTAAIMAGIAVGNEAGSALLPLKLSSAVLYLGATVIMIIMNKIQPSQLAEEQRNASRLFKQLHAEISSNSQANTLSIILTTSLEPAVWWPQHMDQSHSHNSGPIVKGVENGWSQGLEEEMREIISVLRRKDDAEYIQLGKFVLNINMILAVCGPMLTCLAATGVSFIGSPILGSMPSLFGIVFGALATIMNTVEHGGRMGMVFEMYRSSAGFFKLMEENIETTLEQRQEIRENGQEFEKKVALELGRHQSELRDLASASCSRIPNSQEFASKLF